MPEPTAELAFSRIIAAPRMAVWRCWTEPELLKQWFCPRPWKTIEARIDLRSGGEFYTLMRGPDGESPSGEPGIWLEVEHGTKLVFTDAFKPGWIPTGAMMFVATLRFSDVEGGTLYEVSARHWTEEKAKAHEAMGFYPGWGAATDQLEELAKTL